MQLTVPVLRLFAGESSPRTAKQRDIEKVGPRTSMGSKNVRVGDLVLISQPGDRTRLCLVTGGRRVAGRWTIQLGPPPGVMPVPWVPQSCTLRCVERAWGRRGRT